MIVLSGRYAGKKAVVVRAHDEGNDKKKFGHAVGKFLITKYILHMHHHHNLICYVLGSII